MACSPRRRQANQCQRARLIVFSFEQLTHRGIRALLRQLRSLIALEIAGPPGAGVGAATRPGLEDGRPGLGPSFFDGKTKTLDNRGCPPEES